MRGSTGSAASDAGFVLFEVLVSAALVALAGTSVLLICNSALRNQDAQLDRSVALVNMDGLAEELLAFGDRRYANILPTEDEQFVYRWRVGDVIGGASSFRTVTVEATAKSGPSGALSIAFLAPLRVIDPK